VLAGLLSLIIPLAAWIRGVPYVTLVRMAANLAIGVLVGSIPLFGDIFDIAWKANRRNYRCSPATSTNRVVTPGAIGRFSGFWQGLSPLSSPRRWCWSCGCSHGWISSR
jgi:hypothetical protein